MNDNTMKTLEARSQSVECGLREALIDAYEAGALAVHGHWSRNPGIAPLGDPEFGEASRDFADYRLAALSSTPEVTSRNTERDQIVNWLNSEAQDCYDRMVADLESDLAIMYGQRYLYYKQAASMISRGAHLVASSEK